MPPCETITGMGDYGGMYFLGEHGVYFLEGDAWRRHKSAESAPKDAGQRFIAMMVFDSAFADVHYRAAQGEPVWSMFVGQTPRSYFADAREPSCTNPEPLARALATWAGNGVTPEQVRPFVAVDGVASPDRSVEGTLERLVAVLGLPAIEW